MASGMKKEGELTEAGEVVVNVVDDGSWFAGSPHYWAETWLPLAHAVACVRITDV